MDQNRTAAHAVNGRDQNSAQSSLPPPPAAATLVRGALALAGCGLPRLGSCDTLAGILASLAGAGL